MELWFCDSDFSGFLWSLKTVLVILHMLNKCHTVYNCLYSAIWHSLLAMEHGQSDNGSIWLSYTQSFKHQTMKHFINQKYQQEYPTFYLKSNASLLLHVDCKLKQYVKQNTLCNNECFKKYYALLSTWPRFMRVLFSCQTAVSITFNSVNQHLAVWSSNKKTERQQLILLPVKHIAKCCNQYSSVVHCKFSQM